MPQPEYHPRMRFARSVLALGAAVLSLAVASACSDAKDEAGGGGDARADSEAPADTGPSSDSGPTGPSFCETLPSAPFFCADFDDGAPADQVFRTVSGGAKVEQQELHVASDGADAFVEHDADPSPQWTRIELGFSLRIDAASSDARAVLARIGQHQTDTECRVELELQQGGMRLRGGGADAALTKKIATGTKARVVLAIDATGDGGSVKGSVTVDGQPAVAAPLDLGCARLPGPPRITLGRMNASGTADLRFDDVVFDGL